MKQIVGKKQAEKILNKYHREVEKINKQKKLKDMRLILISKIGESSRISFCEKHNLNLRDVELILCERTISHGKLTEIQSKLT